MRSPRLLFAALALTLSAAPLVAPTQTWAKEGAGALSPSVKWEKEIAAFEAADKIKAPEKGGIVFVGSSSIRLWKTLSEDFSEYNVLNRGFGGSEMGDSLYFADRIIAPYQPRLVVVYAGGNDLAAGKTPEEVLENFKKLVARVRVRFPKTAFAYISVAGNPARWKMVEQVKAANALIAAYAQSQPEIKFIDVFSKMLGEDGLPKPDIFVADKLHMNPEGYKIWTEVVRPYLAP